MELTVNRTKEQQLNAFNDKMLTVFELGLLSSSEHEEVRINVAKNGKISNDIAMHLANDKSLKVRLALITNTAIGHDVIRNVAYIISKNCKNVHEMDAVNDAIEVRNHNNASVTNLFKKMFRF